MRQRLCTTLMPALANFYPGRLEDELIRIRPGGNRVRAYLDILTPDTIALNDLLSTLGKFFESLSSLDNPLVTHDSTITIRFGVEPALENERAEQFKMLVETIRPLLEARVTS